MKFVSKSLPLLLLAATLSPGAVFAQRTRQEGDAPRTVPPPQQQQTEQGAQDGQKTPKVSAPVPPAPPNVVPAKYMGGFAGYRKKQEGMLTFDDRNQRLVFRDKRASRWFWRRAGDSRNSLVATYHVNAKETLFEA